MNLITEKIEIDKVNEDLRDKSPIDIVKWALIMAKKPILTTNFGPYSAAIIHAVTTAREDINVVWCDTGYNTPDTYKFANSMIESLQLNIDIYVPKQTTAYRDVMLGLPHVDDPKHKTFTKQVKLEPFKRAMAVHKPGVWFTNLRKGQTAFRDSIDIVSKSADGILKVSPFYYYSDTDLDKYLEDNNLPNELKYFDPTKVLENRECGLHI
ncbi:MAG: phosphoadenosine phosphosulfate reductase family protein [Flavobacteriaceae bacterium]|nr:phosphoadenosine phosphosulfate reductase family protein [Flavobacteriaceae bacterium]